METKFLLVIFFPNCALVFSYENLFCVFVFFFSEKSIIHSEIFPSVRELPTLFSSYVKVSVEQLTFKAAVETAFSSLALWASMEKKIFQEEKNFSLQNRKLGKASN